MKQCPYCGALGNIYFRVSSRTYNQCSECDLIYKESEKSDDAMIAHYRNDYFSMYSGDQMDRTRYSLFGKILDLIEKRQSAGRLLDVGAGCGLFLAIARERGWKVKGIDPSIQSVEMAKRQYGLDVYNGSLEEYDEDEKYDVITFINVLEHSAEPWKEIERAVDLLKPGGILYLRFPNGFLHTYLFQLASIFGLAAKIQKYLVFHQFSFTPKFIKRLLSYAGFTDMIILNSPPSEGDPDNLFFAPAFAQYVKKSIYLIAQFIRSFSCQKIFLGTSLEVTAVKPKLGVSNGLLT